MSLFKKSSESSAKQEGVRFFNFSAEKDEDFGHNIYLVDAPKPKKKKKSSISLLKNLLFGEDDEQANETFDRDEVSKHIRKISNLPEDASINFFLHTSGGDGTSCEMLARTIMNHKGTTRAFIPQYAFSAGTLIALACDEIYMTQNANLGPIDSQLVIAPVHQITEALEECKDETKFVAHLAQKVLSPINQDHIQIAKKVLKYKMKDKYSEKIYDLFHKDHAHGYQIDFQELQEHELPVKLIKVTWRDDDCQKVQNCDIRPAQEPPQEPVQDQ